MENSKITLAIELGGTNTRLALLDEQLNALAFFVQADPAYDLARLQKYIDRFIVSNNINAFNCIALSVAGALAPDAKSILAASNLGGLVGINLVETLGELYHTKVILQNDINSSLTYNISKGDFNSDGITLLVRVGTGVGSAFAFNGKIHNGANNLAGESGHVPVLGDSKECNCGKVGCIEMYSSGEYLTRLQREYSPYTPIEDIFKTNVSYEIADKLTDGIANVLITNLNIIDPTNVLIGGGVIEMEGFPMKMLEDKVNAGTFGKYTLTPALKQKEQGVIGVAIYANQQIVGAGDEY